MLLEGDFFYLRYRNIDGQKITKNQLGSPFRLTGDGQIKKIANNKTISLGEQMKFHKTAGKRKYSFSLRWICFKWLHRICHIDLWGWKIFIPIADASLLSSSSKCTDNTDSLDSLAIHPTKMINISFCRSDNRAVSMYRSPQENVVNEFFVHQESSACLVNHIWMVCEMRDKWPYSSYLLAVASWICSRQHGESLCIYYLAFSPRVF